MQPAAVTGPIAPASTAGTMMVPWLCAGELAQRAEHAAVEGQRRIGVDVAEHDGMAVDVLLAEQHSAMRIASRAWPGVSGVASQPWSL